MKWSKHILVFLLSLVGYCGSISAQQDQGALYFDDFQWAIIPSHESYMIGKEDFTVEATIRVDTPITSKRIIFSNDGTTDVNGFTFLITKSGKLALNFAETDALEATTHKSIVDGNCHHVAAQRMSDSVHFFVDGILESSVYDKDQALIDTDHAIWIGFVQGEPLNSGMNGVIREVRLWRKAISADSILLFHDRLIYTENADLIGYWRLNESKGQEVYDYSESQNNGYLGFDKDGEDSNEPKRVQSCPLNTNEVMLYHNNELVTEITVCVGSKLVLYASGDDSYTWYFGEITNGPISFTQEYEHVVSESGFLFVRGLHGDVDSVQLTVKNDLACFEGEIEVFDVVTVNGDKRNDTFCVLNLEYFPNAVVEIFNKWGDQLLSTQNYDNSWPGSLDQPPGTYFYHISIPEREKEYTGSIILLN